MAKIVALRQKAATGVPGDEGEEEGAWTREKDEELRTRNKD